MAPPDELVSVLRQLVGDQAVVDLDEPMGADSLIWLSLGGQTLSARVDSSMRFRGGGVILRSGVR